jgi:hypothetical protein
MQEKGMSFIHDLCFAGSFEKHDFCFKTYIPTSRTVEDSQVPEDEPS